MTTASRDVSLGWLCRLDRLRSQVRLDRLNRLLSLGRLSRLGSLGRLGSHRGLGRLGSLSGLKGHESRSDLGKIDTFWQTSQHGGKLFNHLPNLPNLLSR